MSLLEFFLRHQREILQATVEHIWLVGVTMVLSVAIGVPLGILVTRRPWLSKPILGGANIAETIPSLALFGFLLPVPWLGGRGRARSSAWNGDDGWTNFISSGAASFAFDGAGRGARGNGADNRHRHNC